MNEMNEYGPIPIRSAMRQGCPMSMALYTLCLHPLLQYLDQKLPGVKIRRRARHTAVVAYADDVTLFISAVTDFAIIEEALLLFEKASEASINPRKSKVLGVGGWRAQETIRGIQYHPSVTILGITFWATIYQTTKDTWARITGKVRTQAKKAYDRDPCLARRIQYVHNCLKSKLWYTAQILLTHQTVHATLDYSRDVVHLEGNNFQSETLNSTAPEEDGRDGID